MDIDFTNLDPQVVSLARAIRTVETNGNFTKSNPDGNGWSVGAYQWHGADEQKARQHFQAEASQFGLDPHDFSPINQDKVAYAKMKTWRDEGFHAGEIAAMWNGARTVNGRPVPINPEYVTKVQKALGSSPSSTYSAAPFSGNEIPVDPNSPNQVAPIAENIGDKLPGFLQHTGIDANAAYDVGKRLPGELAHQLNPAELVKPETTGIASGVRAIQSTPRLLRGLGGFLHDVVETDPSTLISAIAHPGRYSSPRAAASLQKANETMKKPLLGVKPLAAMNNTEAAKTGLIAALQLAGMKYPEDVKAAGTDTAKLAKGVLNLIRGSGGGLLGKAYSTAKTGATLYGGYQLLKHSPLKGLASLASHLLE